MTRNQTLAWSAVATAALAAAVGFVALWRKRAADRADTDEAVTEASMESFPASDAPSHTPTTGSSTWSH